MSEEITIKKEQTYMWELLIPLVFMPLVSVMFRYIKSMEETDIATTVMFWVLSASLFIYPIIFIFKIIKFFRRRKDKGDIGIRIDSEGIWVYYGVLKDIGVIAWEDIELLGLKNTFSKNLLFVRVKNPENYINKVNEFNKRRKLKEYKAKYKTPLVIETQDLEISNYKLKNLIKGTVFFLNKNSTK